MTLTPLPTTPVTTRHTRTRLTLNTFKSLTDKHRTVTREHVENSPTHGLWLEEVLEGRKT